MYSTKTFTFKTRRKSHHLTMLVSLFILTLSYAASYSMPCPPHCDCFVSLQGLNSMKTASCNDVRWNTTVFPNIRVLKMKPPPSEKRCKIPEDAALVFPNLELLDLSNCSISSIPVNDFRHFKNLQTIDLSHNQLRHFHRFTFASNRFLRYVSLEDNPLNQIQSTFLESTSLNELNLASCNLDKVPLSTFKALPNLWHLTISNNKLKTLKDNTLPDNLRTLDISKNYIVNVPIKELTRLTHLTQINLSENPANCTCPLLGFQNWVSGKGVLFMNNIKCAYPEQYVGYKLVDVPSYEVCDAKIQTETPSSSECTGNQICTNGIAVEEGFVADQAPEEAFQQDQVFSATNSDLSDVSTLADDGSGDGATLDFDLGSVPAKKKPKYGPSDDMPFGGSGDGDIQEGIQEMDREGTRPNILTSDSTEGVIKMEEELNPSTIADGSTQYSSSTPATSLSTEEASPIPDTTPAAVSPPTTANESSANSVAETSPSSSSTSPPATAASGASETVPTEGETMTVTESAGTDSHTQKLQTQNSGREMAAYIVPGLAVFLIGLICVAVYGSQCAKKARSPRRYKPASVSHSDGSEMQEVSLLPDEGAQPAIIKYTGKYSNDKNPTQTERLMDEADQSVPATKPAMETNKLWGDDCKPTNGQLTNGQVANGNKSDIPANVECTIAKVTTLPDSIPKTPIIRNL